MTEQLVQIKPATDRGNAEQEIVINMRHVVFIRRPQDEERGTCTFIMFNGECIPTWEHYEVFVP